MMLTISLITQKGGAGKSTLVSSLAVAAHEAGERVSILDLDPQQSLVKWSTVREKADIAVEAVSLDRLDLGLERLAASGVTLCILDTAGTESAMTTAAIEASDLCIIPVRPNIFDLWAGERTRRVIGGLGKDSVFLLNQCPPAQQSARVQEGVRALEAMGVLISPTISSRVDFQDAARFGSGVTEFNRSGQAADEIRKLWGSIARLANKSVLDVAELAGLDDCAGAIVEQEGRLGDLRGMSA
jgi:chromosome partitioning protein